MQTRGKYMKFVIYHSSTANEPRNTSIKNLLVSEKEKQLPRAIKQSKIRQVRNAKDYMFDFLIPRNYTEAWNLTKLITTVNGMMPVIIH